LGKISDGHQAAGIQGPGGDDRVGQRRLLPVLREDRRRGFLGRDLPPLVVRRQVDLLPGDDGAEPEALDIQGQVPDHAQAGPAGRQHRAPQVLLGQAVQDAKHVLALAVQVAQQQACLRRDV